MWLQEPAGGNGVGAALALGGGDVVHGGVFVSVDCVGELVGYDASSLSPQEPGGGEYGPGLFVPECECAGRWLGFDDADTQGRGVAVWIVCICCWSHENLVNRG